ncbi:MAG TPA: hypothetical protein VL326_28845 [Kofleriaceae bacterium]|nr:hypothetical protein [Kofleriaceae bacterium]
MNELLAPASSGTQSDDFAIVLDAIDRLGTPALSRMGETFLLLAQDQLDIALPAVVDRIGRTPMSGAGNLAADVICELLEYVPGGIARMDRASTLKGLVSAVEQISQTACERGCSAVRALALWAAREPIPEAVPALAGLLSEAVSRDRPNPQLVRDAVAALRSSRQDQLLERIRERAAQLSAAHPVRQALG